MKNLIKYTFGLPLIIIGTLFCIVAIPIVFIFELIGQIFSIVINGECFDFIITSGGIEFLKDLWKPIKE